MHGVFLHVLADTLGSVGVIFSTFLIQKYNIRIADPICAFIISILILMSVFPLVSHSSRVLLHRAPEVKESEWWTLQQTICNMDGVIGLRDCHLFAYTGEMMICSMKIGVGEGKQDEVFNQVDELLNKIGLNNHAIQVERAEDPKMYMNLKREGDLMGTLYHHNHHDHDHDHCDNDHHHDHHHDYDHEHHDHHDHDHDHHGHDHNDHDRSIKEQSIPIISMSSGHSSIFDVELQKRVPGNNEHSIGNRQSQPVHKPKLLVSRGKLD